MTNTWKPLEELWAERDEKAKIARIILDELYEYALTGQVYPHQRGFFHYLTEPQVVVSVENGRRVRRVLPARYPNLTIGSYNHWFDRLKEEGYLFVDRRNGSHSIGCTQLVIVEREEPVPQSIQRPEPDF